MKIFKTTPQYRILEKKKFAFVVSALLLLASVVGMATKGLTYGIDFRGGTIVQVKFQDTPKLKQIRKLFKDKLGTSVNISTFGEESHNEVMITLPQEAIQKDSGKLQALIAEVLQKDFPGFDVRRIETVGPKVGQELKDKAFYAAIYALAGILLYIWVRFRIQFGIAAVVALFHDVMITLGIFVIMDKEFTLTIVAALLTIIGYSLNDTIVVFDRVRENVARMPKKPIEEVINISINESMSRTILTSITTFFVVACLFIFGGDIIHDFSFAMLIGLVVGTYSSVFVASPTVIALDAIKADKPKVPAKAK